MALTATALAALLATTAACAREEPARPAPPPPGRGDVTPPRADAPGVGVVSATELGPQARRVTVTSRSPEALAQFERGRALLENIREVEAAEALRAAIAADPSFALAHAYLGIAVAGPAGRPHIDRALELAPSLPESERLVISALAARRAGKVDEERQLYQRLTRIAPDDWRPFAWLGRIEQRSGRLDEAFAVFSRATALNPRAGDAYNNIAYLHAHAGRWDEALIAARRYAELAPDEPNPHDSLGEILMMAGRFDEAETAFRKALAVAPQFAMAEQGIAATYFYRQRWDDGIAAMERARRGTGDAIMRLEVGRAIAWAHLAAGRPRRALAAVDALEREAEAQRLPGQVLYAQLVRADVLNEQGKHAAARRAAPRVLDAWRAPGAPEGGRGGQVAALIARLWAEVSLERVGDAEGTLAEIERLTGGTPRPGDCSLPLARGIVALARKDAPAAVDHLKTCDGDKPLDLYAQIQLSRALDQIGNTAKAKAVRAQLAQSYRRDPLFVYLRGRALADAG
jgi:tetratricopeptide (TPR) repeat protein